MSHTNKFWGGFEKRAISAGLYNRAARNTFQHHVEKNRSLNPGGLNSLKDLLAVSHTDRLLRQKKDRLAVSGVKRYFKILLSLNPSRMQRALRNHEVRKASEVHVKLVRRSVLDRAKP